MKKISLLFTAVLIGFSTISFAQDTEEDAIKETVLNYIEGWYDGDVDRMDKALHPELVKRQIHTFKPTGTDLVNGATKSAMLVYTEAGFGKQTPREKINNVVEVLDIYHGIATVKATSYDFVDYCHVVKYNGEWKIINVLWDRNHEKEE